MSSVVVFSDDDRIDWIDRETFAYVRGDQRVSIWVDYERGIFRTGRVIRKASLMEWIDNDSNRVMDPVSENDTLLIVGRLAEYFQSNGKKARVDTSPLPVDWRS